MHGTGFRSLLIVSAVAFASVGAPAQNAPRIKPGLWQIQVERAENGQKLADPSERMKEHMKNMPPERRKQFEEMMKQRGVDPGADGAMKVCYSQKMVERGAWDDQGACKTAYSNRSASAWKWHSVCSKLGYEGDGEASFPDPEHFVVKSSGVSTIGSMRHASTSVRTGKWLSADCGNVKPMDSTQ